MPACSHAAVCFVANPDESLSPAMHAIRARIATGLLAAAPAIAGDNPPDVVAFRADVRVEVDASGKPVKIAARLDLPDASRLSTGASCIQQRPAFAGRFVCSE